MSRTAQVQPPAAPADVVHLRAAGVSLVLDARDGRLPAVLHWGHDLGDARRRPTSPRSRPPDRPTAVPNDLDEPHRPPARCCPSTRRAGTGGPGSPGPARDEAGRRSFALTGFRTTADLAGGGGSSPPVPTTSRACTVRLEVELLPSGLVRQRGTVTTTADGDLHRRRPDVDAARAAGRDGAVRPRRPLGPGAVPAAAALRRRRALAGEPARADRTGRPADPRGRAPPGSTRGRARSGPCTWRGAATTSPTPSG